jgi:hypothetical protein
LIHKAKIKLADSKHIYQRSAKVQSHASIGLAHICGKYPAENS